MALGLGLSSLSDAHAAGPYVGASVGWSNADYSASDWESALAGKGYTVTDASVDDTDTGWKVFGGFMFTPNLGVEGAYVDLGEIESEATANIDPANIGQLASDAADVHPFMAKGLVLAGVARMPVGPKFAVFGKAGLFRWESEVEIDVTAGGSSASADIDEDGTDWVWGVGGMYDVNNRVSVRGEWERYRVQDDWIDFGSIGVQVSF